MNFSRVVAVILGLALFAGAGVFFLLRSSHTAESLYRARTAVGLDAAVPEHHILPAGFRGWAVVRYGVSGAPALPERDGKLVLEYPPDGRLQTSTPVEDVDGFLHREYLRQTDGGLVPLSRMGEVWGEFNMRLVGNGGDPAAPRRLSGFFVGTREEYRAAGPPVEEMRQLEQAEIPKKRSPGTRAPAGSPE
jgi:hypothetical protein